VKSPFVLLFLTVFVRVFADGGDGRENLIAALKQEGVVFTERTAAPESGGGAIWALIPSTEKTGEDTPSSDEDTVVSSLLEEYTSLAGEISALATSDVPVEFPEDSFILVIPLSGDESGLSGEYGLSFIRELKKRHRRQNIIVAFLDCAGGGGESLNALQDIYASLDNPENSILLFLDFPAPPGELAIYHGSRFHLAPLGILEPLTRLLENRGIPYTFGVRFNELYQFALIGGTPVTEFTQSRGIPSLVITGVAGAGETGKGPLAPDSLGELLADYAEKAAVKNGSIDNHYSMYHFQGKTWFVSETASVIILLVIQGIVVIVLLFFFLVQRLKMLLHVKIGLTNSWVSLLYFFALFLSILAGEALLFAFAALSRVSLAALPLNRLYPAIGLASLAGILLFFTVPAPLLAKIRIKRRGSFYGFTAVCFSILLLLLGSVLDITATPLLAWMLVCVLLTMLLPRAAPVFFFSLALLVRPALTFAHVLGDRELSRLFLARSFLSALTLTLFALPFLLSLMRATVFIAPRRIGKKPVSVFIKPGLLVLCAVFLEFFVISG
jgi:hypothetical protein